jgi:hypothetical protein
MPPSVVGELGLQVEDALCTEASLVQIAIGLSHYYCGDEFEKLFFVHFELSKWTVQARGHGARPG